MLKFFAEKMWVAFAVQKQLMFFSAKNIRVLHIESAKTVNEMTLNKLVKLTTLWTTGPRMPYAKCRQQSSTYCIYPRYLDNITPYHNSTKLWTSLFYPLLMYLWITARVANCLDPQEGHSAASHLDLHRLPNPVCPNT